MTRAHLLTLLSLSLLGLAACQPGTPTEPEGPPAAECQAATDLLADLTYSPELIETGSVELQAGEYRAPAAPGSASEIIVQLTHHVACGELASVPSAAVILVSTAGGSGTFYSLHAVQPLDETMAEVADTMLGDRVKVQRVAIDQDLIHVDLVTHAPDDPLCCPTQAVRAAYAVDGTRLRLVSRTPQSPP